MSENTFLLVMIFLAVKGGVCGSSESFGVLMLTGINITSTLMWDHLYKHVAHIVEDRYVRDDELLSRA